MTSKTVSRQISKVLELKAADPEIAVAHLNRKLALETDPSDVYADIQNGETGFLVVDTRSPEAYAKGHVPGAINLWHKTIDKTETAKLPKDKLLVTYCTSVACNASTKGALKLAALGFRVKEMIGGLEAWREEGYPIE